MRYNSPAFLAWQDAERLASEAERKLFAKLCEPSGAPPSQDEVKETRALREDASGKMKRMLEEMREMAGLLKYSRDKPGVPISVVGVPSRQERRDSEP